MTHHHSPSDPEIRTKALEALLVEKGLITSDKIDEIVQSYEEDIGPMRGAQVVARAWVDPDYRRRLLADGREAVAELGFAERQGAELVVVENTPDVHNIVVCTLCSCYPWAVLGLPPTWYKSFAYRSRAVSSLEPSSRSLARNSPNPSKCASGTATRISGIWCSPSDRRDPRT